MHRFFVPPQAFASHPVVLTGDQAHQIRRVLRLRLGERIELLDGQGFAYEAILIALGEADAKLQVVSRWEVESEPRTHVTLFQAVLKGDNFTWALQKGTEVGVSRFVPTICARNVVDDLDAAEGKRERWARSSRKPRNRAVAAGCRSSRRLSFAPALSYPSAERALRLIAWEDEQANRLRDVLAGCNFADGARIEVFIGPEGGFAEEEVAAARRYGIQPVTLGPRILRAETAGVVAATLILCAAGN